MNLKDFIAGRLFDYTGHFMRLKRKPLQFNAARETITDADGLVYDIKHYNEGSFIAYHNGFGNIPILFSECKLTVLTQ